MIDVIGIVEQNVSDWNDETKCGWCWEFTAPLRESDLNEYQKRGDECCVVVAITEYRPRCVPGYDRATGMNNLGYNTYSFNLHILYQGDIGLNVYNEIKDHPLSESKWKTTLQPLWECIGCKPLDFCTFTGFPVEILRWGDAIPRMDWLDNNYDGWTIPVQLRENNTQ